MSASVDTEPVASTPRTPAAPPAAAPRRSARATSVAARGEPFVWLAGAGLAAAILMIAGLLALVLARGAVTFWPVPLVEFTLRDGTKLLGEISREEAYRPAESELAALPAADRSRIVAGGGWSRRVLLRTGNFDLYGDDFRWIPQHDVVSRAEPEAAWIFERTEWGRAMGFPVAILADGVPQPLSGNPSAHALIELRRREARARAAAIRRLERHELGSLNTAIEEARLSVRRAALRRGDGSPEHREAALRAAAIEEQQRALRAEIEARIAAIRSEDEKFRLEVREIGGRLVPERPSSQDTPILFSQIVRAYPANSLTWLGSAGVFLDRWKEFLAEEPREANTEGGIFPALFGTLMMTVMMSLAVAPFGVVAALYLREYAKQGALVSAVRIAVNNLAGVPSIVFGVFGLGFFCYLVGGTIDQVFFPERLPAPTWGTGGLLWASLTLALLTVPVVIVATEEALAAVPRSLREGSFACGASKWQTVRRIVLPRATPGIMTGLILAMARGAGEVAPLMITGVVKLAPDLPVDGNFPFLHLERSFMHLGFHIYDVGFQSRNAEAAKPMVFTTTLLLISLVALMNLLAIALRSRLRRRFTSDHF